MKPEQRTTISLYGTTYNELTRYKKKKELIVGYQLTFQQAIATMLGDIKTLEKTITANDEKRKLL